MKKKIIFFGSSEFATESLQEIINKKYNLIAVVTNPDKRSGRGMKISETKINGDLWKKKHWNALRVNYQKARFFNEISGLLADFYQTREFEFLSDANRYLIDLICGFLDIRTKISSSAELNLPEDKNERLISMCKQVKADVYLSGRSAQGYIDLDKFSNAGIAIEWFDYDDYPEYDQLWGRFVHEVSILDLLFNCGKRSTSFMKFAH